MEADSGEEIIISGNVFVALLMIIGIELAFFTIHSLFYEIMRIGTFVFVLPFLLMFKHKRYAINNKGIRIDFPFQFWSKPTVHPYSDIKSVSYTADKNDNKELTIEFTDNTEVIQIESKLWGKVYSILHKKVVFK